MAKLDFTQYLKTSMDDIPKSVPSLPGGHFFADIKDWSTGTQNFGEDRSEVPVVFIHFSITVPDDDVEDMDLVPTLPKIVKKSYELNDPDRRGQIAIRRLAEVTCELPVSGYELDGVLDALKGCQVKVHSAPRPNKKEEGQYFDNIDKVLPVNG